MFAERKLVIATKHGKEQVIAPHLERALGVSCFVASDLDTDQLGTFSGEVARTLDPIAAAVLKCEMAMALTGCDLAVASEGSFGPHPAMYFVSADDEMLVLVDRKHRLQIVARALSTATNFNARDVSNENELMAFAQEVGFPAHGLILRRSQTTFDDIIKGITNVSDLREGFNRLMSQYGQVYVETDMRAHLNPTRMKVIEEATLQLLEKLSSLCPQCQTPGYSVTQAKKGLPCGLCGLPTATVRSHVYVCAHCAFSHEVDFPGGQTTQDAMYCDFCNP
jgi:hypothetical protein